MKRILVGAAVLIPLGFVVASGCSADDSSGLPKSTQDKNSGGSGGGSGGSSTGSSGDTSGTGGDKTSESGGSAGTESNGGSNQNGGSGGGGTTNTGGGGTMTMPDAGTTGTDPCASGGDAQKCIDDVAGGTSNFGISWKDSWFITGCAQKAGHDCVTIPQCPNQNLPDAQFEDKGSVINETFPLGGIKDKDYLVSFKYNGVSEAKFMQDGSWADPKTDLATPGSPAPNVNENGIADNTFYIGGKAVPSLYNVMRLRVLDSTGKEIGRYYMNGYDRNSGAESHRTFLMSYSHTIPVKGGGKIEYHIADSNCHAIDNCGAGNVSDTSCDGPRNIPNETNIKLPLMYSDVSKQATTPAGTPKEVLVSTSSLNPITGGMQPWHSQIGHFTITKIVEK